METETAVSDSLQEREEVCPFLIGDADTERYRCGALLSSSRLLGNRYVDTYCRTARHTDCAIFATYNANVHDAKPAGFVTFPQQGKAHGPWLLSLTGFVVTCALAAFLTTRYDHIGTKATAKPVRAYPVHPRTVVRFPFSAHRGEGAVLTVTSRSAAPGAVFVQLVRKAGTRTINVPVAPMSGAEVDLSGAAGIGSTTQVAVRANVPILAQLIIIDSTSVRLIKPSTRR
ncbi:MAG: hypothetical protein ACR2GA_03925 [Chloroflexota bacterium]